MAMRNHQGLSWIVIMDLPWWSMIFWFRMLVVHRALFSFSGRPQLGLFHHIRPSRIVAAATIVWMEELLQQLVTSGNYEPLYLQNGITKPVTNLPTGSVFSHPQWCFCYCYVNLEGLCKLISWLTECLKFPRMDSQFCLWQFKLWKMDHRINSW